ncbi:M14 family metallopeptidase [Paenibacillus thalictri]|uniref:Peptidase M14 n=1 Tax=Paenibacillus thalictri TaxID=2527873 RepID=A0A4Q9DZC4_9BACL|nr:M14 family metallocarboxypeptidase [Paenibacillus thalictri]TBL81203.1 peptidase M14 [Paenibacillus thalictri]
MNGYIVDPVRLGGYRYDTLMCDLELLTCKYPFVQAAVIGESVLGNPIPAIRIGTGDTEVHYNGAVHANEWITTPLLMRFAEQYAMACVTGMPLYGRNMEEWYEKTSLWIVPMVNPDGVQLVHEGVSPLHPLGEELVAWNGGSCDFSGWKANIRGVDLNDQFPAHWEEERERRQVFEPGPRDFGGLGPLSEPEAQVLAVWTCSRNFRQVLSFHSQGREIYWNYRDCEPPEAERTAKRLGRASGYAPVHLTGSDAGYKDWFIQQFRRPGFTVEVGLGVNPLPVSQFEELYHEVAGLMLEGLNVEQTG